MNKLKQNQFNLKNESGYTLILTLIGLLLISVISMSLIVLSNNSVNVSKIERTDQSVYYIAEAGVNLAKAELNKYVQPAAAAAKQAVEDEERAYEARVEAARTELDVPPYDAIYSEKFFKVFDEQISQGPLKIPVTYDNFESVGYYENGKPYTEVTVKKISTTPNQYEIVSEAKIDNQTRKVENKISFKIDSLGTTYKDVILTENESGSGTGTGSGTSDNIYTSNTNLVTLSKPTLNGNAWKSAVTKTVKDYTKTDDPVISQLYSEYEYHKKVCENPNNANKDASYEVYKSVSATKKNSYDMNINSKPEEHTIYITGDVNLDKGAFNINATNSKNINVVICGNLSGTNGNGSALNGTPAKEVNVFVMGTKSNINNIGINLNFVFAPEVDIVFGGNVDLCTTLFSKSFTGNGSGNGGFTNSCSKPEIVVPPSTGTPSTSPPTTVSITITEKNSKYPVIQNDTLKEID